MHYLHFLCHTVDISSQLTYIYIIKFGMSYHHSNESGLLLGSVKKFTLSLSRTGSLLWKKGEVVFLKFKYGTFCGVEGA